MYTAGHVYVFVSTKGSLWCWNTSGPRREKHCWYASHGFLFFFSVWCLFMDGPVYSRFFLKAALERNANSNHQVCYNFKHRENKPSWMIWCKTNILNPGACILYICNGIFFFIFHFFLYVWLTWILITNPEHDVLFFNQKNLGFQSFKRRLWVFEINKLVATVEVRV